MVNKLDPAVVGSRYWADLKTTDFARLDLACCIAVLPVAAIGRFRHRLEKRKLAAKILAMVNALLTQHGLLFRAKTVVDADSGLAHTVRGTFDHVSDIAQAHTLMHGQEALAFGNAGCQCVEKRPDANP